MRGTHDAHVDGDRLIRAESFDTTFLKGTEQLGLDIRAHVANLVQEQCAAVCLFKLPFPPRCGPL
jgi:hypothetical protein